MTATSRSSGTSGSVSSAFLSCELLPRGSSGVRRRAVVQQITVENNTRRTHLGQGFTAVSFATPAV